MTGANGRSWNVLAAKPILQGEFYAVARTLRQKGRVIFNFLS
jgi:hypothetical protein